MTTVAYALGRPRAAASRGGDCRAHDLDQDRDVHGPHRFAVTTHAQISNGMLRLTVGASGVAPALTVEAWRGRVVINDVYTDVYTDLYEGDIATPAWLEVGTITIDSPAVSALLTAVQIASIRPEELTVRLVAPLIGDAYVTLKRGRRAIEIQHGRTRSPLVTTTRRVRWTDSPSPVGAASQGRVEELTSAPDLDGLRRMVASIDPVTVTAGTFSVASASVSTARFVAGVATQRTGDRAVDIHRQARDTSRPRLVVR